MQSVHKAVLLNEVVEGFFNGPRISENPVYFDGTLGGAGHAAAIADAFKGKVRIIALDLDQRALDRASETLKGKCSELILEKENFKDIDKVLSKHLIKSIDLLLLDLGLSSDELEAGGKGFSFQKDEPLLMTIGDPDAYPFTAKDIVNNWKEEDIANVIFGYGEDKYARRIAKRIVEYRQKTAIQTSAELAEIVKGAVPKFFTRSKIHPATRTFQALRITVNDELNVLRDTLKKGYDALNKNGKMAIISFHSLEDRIVKEFMKSKEKKGEATTSKKAIKAGDEEIAQNPRSRSAKLRFLYK